MYILTHCKANFEVLKNRKLTPEQEALFVLGSFIADVHEFRIVEKKETHGQGPKFLKSLAKKYHYLGAGLVLHGEKPKGLDYYAHEEYIPKKEKAIKKIINHYRKIFPKKIDMSMTAHIIIEFCFEYLTVEKNPHLIKRVNHALKAPILPKAVYNFTNFFNINKKHTKIMLKLRKTDRVRKFIANFKDIEGTARNFQNFIFLKQLRDKNHKPNWLNRITKSSYRYLKSKIKEKQLEQMIGRCVETVRKDYDPFMNKAIKNLKKLAQEYKL
ncbi:MAG: hypothetical protein KAT77_02920 [Nanoarchaeota archaeon]|nr:hypothetical protein [Nanoarchaeota archaeon]